MSNNAPPILIVDDEPNNLLFLEELLLSEGYAPLSAESGEKALKMAREFAPAMILLDVMMPDMDGFEVCRRLREDADLMTVPVIFLTALDDDESRLRGLEMMGDDYITKPIKSNLLLTKIATTLRLYQMRSQQVQVQVKQQLKEKSRRNLSAAWQINQTLTEKFRLFVPEQFLQRIAPSGVESIELGNAALEELAILFCDIRGFTAIAESQEAIETFNWLNAFFTQMNAAIASHHGFIDKFLGDAIMAVFDRKGSYAQDALNAAIMMRKNLEKFNKNRESLNLQEPINIGIGIHAGKALIGTLGSDSRMDSTVIGDAVNSASRLQELTKIYGCQLLASETAIAQLNDASLFYLRWIDRVTLRGKEQPLDIYEVLGTKSCILDEEKVRSLAIFERGIQAWQRGEFAAALSYFEKIIEEFPQDSVAALYMERCQENLGEKSA